jgi:hypothetical protein
MFPDLTSAAHRMDAVPPDDSNDFESALASALSAPASPVARPHASTEPTDRDPAAAAHEPVAKDAVEPGTLARAVPIAAVEPVTPPIVAPTDAGSSGAKHRAGSGTVTPDPVSVAPHAASHRIEPALAEPPAPIPLDPASIGPHRGRVAPLEPAPNPDDGIRAVARVLSSAVEPPVVTPRAPSSAKPAIEPPGEPRASASGSRRAGSRAGASSRSGEHSGTAADRPPLDDRVDPTSTARTATSDARGTRAADGTSVATRAAELDPPVAPRIGGDRVTLQFEGENGLEGRLRVAMRGETLHATLTTAHGETLRRFEAGIQDLQRTLNERGFGGARITVANAAADAARDDRAPDSSRDHDDKRGQGRSQQDARQSQDYPRRPRDRAGRERQA